MNSKKEQNLENFVLIELLNFHDFFSFAFTSTSTTSLANQRVDSSPFSLKLMLIRKNVEKMLTRIVLAATVNLC